MSKYFLLLLTNILFFSLIVSAGKIDRGFDALNEYNYFKAKELFEKALKRKTTAASFGLSLIYSKNNNPFYNLDSAYKYINKSEKAWKSLKERKREKLKRLDIDSVGIQNFKDTIEAQKFKFVLRANSIETYNHFIQNYSKARQFNIAISLRDELAFNEAQQIGTAEAYFMYMNKYPQSAQLIEAKANYELELYNSITKSDSLASYLMFLEQYPESPYVNKAQDQIYSKSTASAQISDYENFVKNYPDNRNLNTAWRNIYKLYTQNPTAERIAEFRLDFPDYPYLDEIMVDYELAAKKFYPILKQDKYGYIDDSGEIVLDFIYDWADFFIEGVAVVSINDSMGVINKQGSVLIPIEYKDIEPFKNALAVVGKNGKYGIINKLNQLILPIEYDEIGSFNDGLALVVKNNLYGFTNTSGDVVIPLKYQSVGSFQNGYAYVEQQVKVDTAETEKSLKGIINSKGELVVNIENDWIEPFNNRGIARARKNNKYGLYTINGSLLVDFIYDNIGEFNNGYALVADSNTYTFINEKGKLITDFKFEYSPEALTYSKFSDLGFAKVMTKGKFGIIDTTGEKVVPAIFDAIGKYKPSGLTAVSKKGKWGYANQDLRLSIQYLYDFGADFVNGKAIVKKDDIYGIIDTDGKLIVPLQYESIKKMDELGYLLIKEDLIQLIDFNLDAIVSGNYMSIEPIDDTLIQLKTNNEIKMFNLKLKKFVWK